MYLKQTLPNIVNLDSVADEFADFKEGRNEGMFFRFRDDIHSASSLQWPTSVSVESNTV